MPKKYVTKNPKKYGFYFAGILGLLLLIFVYVMSRPEDLFYAVVMVLSFTILLFIVIKCSYIGYVLDAVIMINNDGIEIINDDGRRFVSFANIVKITTFNAEWAPEVYAPTVTWKIHILTNKERIKFPLISASAKNFINNILDKKKPLKHKASTSLLLYDKDTYFFK